MSELDKKVESIIFYKGDELSFKEISKILNDEGIRTHKGNLWYNSTVYSVLKRYKQRVNRLNFVNKEYESEWGKFKIKKLKD